MPWGVLAAGVTAAASGANTLINNHNSAAAASKQYHYSRRLFDYQLRRNLIDAPTMELQGLRKAGVNPALAYSTLGGSSQSMPSFSVDTPQSSLDFGGREFSAWAQQKKQLALQREMQDKSLAPVIRKTDADIANNSALTQSKISLARAQIADLQQDTENKRLLPEKTKADIRNINSQIALNQKLAQLHSSSISLNSARVQQLKSDLESDFELSSLRKAILEEQIKSSKSHRLYESAVMDSIRREAGVNAGPLGKFSVFWPLHWWHYDREKSSGKSSSSSSSAKRQYESGYSRYYTPYSEPWLHGLQ